VTYPSLKAYWQNKQGEYINNGYFDDVKKELDETTATIAASSQFGQIPVTRINAVNDFYNGLKSRAEFAPYVDKIDIYRTDSLNKMVTDLSESIYNEADATGDTGKAQTAILNLESKFGIKVSREPFASETAAGKNIAATTTKDIAALKTPSTTEPAAAGTGNTHTVAAGDTLSRIAAQNKVSLNTLLDLNPQYKTNPNLIKPGQTINLPGAQATPAPTKVTPTTATPAPVTPVTPTPATPVVPAAPEPIKPQAPTPAATPTSTPAATPTQPTNQKVYIVKPGDTLSAIAQRELGSSSRAYELKSESGQSYDEKTAKKLQIGTKLVIPL
jgi:LysM repeat protein